MFTNLLISYIIILTVTGLIYGVLNHKKVLNETQIQYLYTSEKAYKHLLIPVKLTGNIIKTIAKITIKLIKIAIYKRMAKQMFNV